MTPDTDEPRLLVRGGHRLSGQVVVAGAKNSALKLMAASLLASGTSILHNVPDIQDVRTMCEVLEYLDAVVGFRDGTMTIDTTAVQSHVAPYDLVQKMRASIQIMGPLVARFGHARVAMPGGCNLGPRKIDIHLRGLAEMGGVVRSDHGFVEVVAPRLRAVDMILDYPSVGATENLLMAAVMAEGTTTLENVAREPEIVDLCKFLVSMGADITGAGSSTMRINGVTQMYPAEHTVIGDRIEAGTFLIMSAVTGGDVEVAGISPHVLDLFLSKLRAVGVEIHENTRSIRVSGDPERYAAVDVATLPYPGFPTDLQAQMMVLLSVSRGVSVLTENVFENRFGFVDELIRLGADIRVDGNHAVISGGRALTGAIVRCPDLRAGAALTTAGLVAEGCTELRDVHHVDRGYERLEEKLRALGADVERVNNVGPGVC
jgi:UDP-N-acetylglucosamine 1-carboxyvinyltransferase